MPRMSTAAPVADRMFRVFGVVALASLLLTFASLGTGIGAWRVPFVAAHLATLLALAPLGVVLAVEAIAQASRDAGSLGGVPAALARRHGFVLLLLAIISVSIAVSLANFSGGQRWLRSTANYVSVVIILTLVVRYLRSARSPRGMR